MIDAELRGKLGAGFSRAHERAEDLLTSTVFGLLRYIDWACGVGAIVQRARVASLCGGAAILRSDPGWLGVEAVSGRVMLWPPAGPFGQPDVFVTLLDRHGAATAEVIFEVKLFSGKSSVAGADVDVATTRPADVDPDQLVRYWQWLASRSKASTSVIKALVYLTAHAIPPLDDLSESLHRAPAMRLAWLSWRDVWMVAQACRDSLPAEDLTRLLAHRGLSWFDGFASSSTPVAFSERRFWQGACWFAPAAAEGLEDECLLQRFWRHI